MLDGTLNLLVPALGWALLNFLWQGLVIGGITLSLLWLLRGSSARWRYATCAFALLLCLTLPLVHFVWLLGQVATAAAPDSVTPAWLQDLQSQLPALVTAWSLGVGLMGARLALGVVWVGRFARRAVPAPAPWQSRLEALARTMGVSRPVALKVMAGLASPVTMGFWRPLVLLPAALLSGMPAPLLEALIAHELAHVRRWDYLANLLQSLVEALLFFHPVVWWLSERLRTEREQVADELAAQALADPRRLAQALHALSQLNLETPSQEPTMHSPHLMLSANGGKLLTRVQRLLLPQTATPSWKLALPAMLLACTSLMVQARNHSPAKPQTEVAALAAVPAVAAPSPSNALPTAAALLHLPVNAKHALVMEEGSGRIVMQKDADAVVPIASLTKLITAMVVLDKKLDPRETLRIQREDVDSLKHSASRLSVGSEISRLTALKMALMASENRAAAALARTYPGGTVAFMQAVQSKIRTLGLAHTSITDPTGLSPANTSTASEVAKIAAAAASYPEIARITSDKSTLVPVTGRNREVHNTNRLVGAPDWDIRLSKTGYTDEAGRCLTVRLKSAARSYIVVLLDADGSPQRLRDAKRIRQSLSTLHI